MHKTEQLYKFSHYSTEIDRFRQYNIWDAAHSNPVLSLVFIYIFRRPASDIKVSSFLPELSLCILLVRFGVCSCQRVFWFLSKFQAFEGVVAHGNCVSCHIWYIFQRLEKYNLISKCTLLNIPVGRFCSYVHYSVYNYKTLRRNTN